MAELIKFHIPLKGRFVSGSMTEVRTKDHLNQPMTPEKYYFNFGVAYPKAEFWAWLTGTFFGSVLIPALAGAPHAAQAAQAWFGNGFNGFKMKISDGDKPNQRGQVSENTKGCFVVWFRSMGEGATARPVSVFTGQTPDTLTQVDTGSVKRGDYFLMSGSIKFNGQSGAQMGIYINYEGAWLLERGEEIAGGVDAATAFAGVVLPPGIAPMDLSNGAGAQFGGAVPMPAPATAPGFPTHGMATPALPGIAPAPAQTAPVASPVPGFTPPGAAPQTAFPGNVQPYYGAMQMQPGQPPAAAPGVAGLPGLPPLPGQ